LSTERPFRTPHHTISGAGLIGGGSVPQPGEISLAHNGILFLDEFTEFKSSTLEALRQPLEHHEVHIARAQHAVHYPASFLLVAALNPCPCGFLDDPRRQCVCSTQRVQQYLSKLSGPLLDRIDIQVAVQSLAFDDLERGTLERVSSQDLKTGIDRAVEAQQKRSNGTRITWNGYLTAKQIDIHCKLTDKAQVVMKQAFEKLQLTMRGYHKLLKVARTIADIAGETDIGVVHVQEAMSYRLIDRLRERK
jgi:magnesium chelatase family protein